jgi:DNA invertase Pin-like site-specific DNA recombinase
LHRLLVAGLPAHCERFWTPPPLNTIEGLKPCGVDLYLDQQAIDTITPSGKLMLQMTGAFAEFERAMMRARIKLCLSHIVKNGKAVW